MAENDAKISASRDKIRITGVRDTSIEARVLVNEKVHRIKDLIGREPCLRHTEMSSSLLVLMEACGHRYQKPSNGGLRPSAPRPCSRTIYFSANTTAPAAISIPPTTVFRLSVSPKNIAANTSTKTTLSLSIGATFDASPSCNARK